MLRVQGEQLVKDRPKPLKVIFTELAVGLENDWHCCPQVQLVITLKGNWCEPVSTSFLILTVRLENFGGDVHRCNYWWCCPQIQVIHTLKGSWCGPLRPVISKAAGDHWALLLRTALGWL